MSVDKILLGCYNHIGKKWAKTFFSQKSKTKTSSGYWGFFISKSVGTYRDNIIEHFVWEIKWKSAYPLFWSRRFLCINLFGFFFGIIPHLGHILYKSLWHKWGGLFMQEYIQKRVLEISNYIIESKSTVRQTAGVFGVSKSTVHIDVIL